MDFQAFLDQVLAVLRDGFANINNPRGLLIALAATIFMGGWRQWAPLSVVAVIVHIAVDVLVPVLSGGEGAQLALPPMMEGAFWIQAGVLLVGYLVVIAIFFFGKTLIFRRGKAA